MQLWDSKVPAVAARAGRGAVPPRQSRPLAPLLAAALLARLASGRVNSALLRDLRPTAQPATRGQDTQECGWLSLPEDVLLSPKTTDGFARSGDIESDAGGVFATWQQDLFSWSYQSISFQVESKLFVKTELITNAEAQLPGVKLSSWMAPGGNILAVKDCNNVLLYTFHESTKPPYAYDIYNRANELVAKSGAGEFFTDQIHFFDDEHKPIVIAQSPKIVADNPAPIGDRAHASMGYVPSWEVRFIAGYGSNSSLLLAQNRWVIVLAVQELAVRGADRSSSGEVMAPRMFPLFIVVYAIFAVAIVFAICSFFVWVYRQVYPKTYPEPPLVENKYLQPFQMRNPYGTVQQ